MLTVAMMAPVRSYRARARDPMTGSSLHRARGQAGDDVLAEDEGQDADGDDSDHAGGEDGPVRDLQRRTEGRNADRDGLEVDVEGERHQEFGPARGEAEDARGEHAG